jgi:16S rRNA (guanine966-N2)-methyltransferase
VRIITGKARGTVLKVPKFVVRPTTDRVRGALFAMIGDFIVDAKVLDLFAGCGSLGLEALSRGARSSLFIEQDRGTCRVIESNLERAKLDGGRVVCQTFEKFLRVGGAEDLDLVFADPPYDTGYREQLLESPEFLARVRQNGILAIDAPAEASPPESEVWNLLENRRYGSSAIWLLQKV